MTDDKTRALIAEAEKHQELVVCGNAQHTNFEIGCPDCAVVCDYCTCPWPCDARRLADALSALTVPDGDARERLALVLYDDCEHLNRAVLADAEVMADRILAEFPEIGRNIAAEISVCAECNETEVLGKPEHRVLCMDCAYETGRAAAPEPEWEYGCRSSAHGEPVTLIIGLDVDEPEDHGLDCPSPALVRRRKAGPWEPLPVGGETDG